MTRYLVRRATKEVFIWAEAISHRKDLEEVYADNAKEAADKKAMPDASKVSVEELEEMNKVDLIIFGAEKFQPPIVLPVKMSRDEMVLLIKARLYGVDDGGVLRDPAN